MARKKFSTLSETMLYVLMSFSQGDMCGVDITAYIAAKSKGRIRIGPGTLYTILNDFKEEKLIEDLYMDGKRRIYRITEKGRRLYYQELDRLRQCVMDADGEVV